MEDEPLTAPNSDRLYQLLPAIYRLRDVAEGEPLRALLAVIEEELNAVEADMDRLYDNWFIETCDEWVIPYIGDLLGIPGIYALGDGKTYSQRAWVANTLRYRRRKGTAAVLEQLTKDLTGWVARVVEFFQLLETTQHLNHLRPTHTSTLSLRDRVQLDLLNGPFDSTAHTADLRPISAVEGKYNIPNIGLFLWRLQSYHVRGGTARQQQDGCYTFNPFGRDAPLFTRPQPEPEIAHLAEEINVPGAIRPGAFQEDIESYAGQYADPALDKRPANSLYYGPDSSLSIGKGTDETIYHPINIIARDLNAMDNISDNERVAVDVRLGRLAFSQGVTISQTEEVLVDYTYGFSGDVGGGPYNRQDSLARVLADKITWQVGVSKTPSTVGDGCIYTTLEEAIEQWNQDINNWNGTNPNKMIGAIALMDSRTYELPRDLPAIKIKPGSQLAIVAADWPEEEAPETLGRVRRTVGKLRLEGCCPHLVGNLSVEGTNESSPQLPGELILNGLWLEGNVTVREGNLGSLRIEHCTIASSQAQAMAIATEKAVRGLISPAQGKIKVNSNNDRLTIYINRSICGPVELSDSVPQLTIADSIISSGQEPSEEGTAIAAPGTDVAIQSSTIFGKSGWLRSLEASDSIFTARIFVTRRQTGCIRFCYVPEESLSPRRYRCQPQLALQERLNQLGAGAALSDAERQAILARLKPTFTSCQFGHPGYAQLSRGCAVEIRRGAEDSSEMGVFWHLHQPQREANLWLALEEYLRFGLKAGLIYVN